MWNQGDYFQEPRRTLGFSDGASNPNRIGSAAIRSGSALDGRGARSAVLNLFAFEGRVNRSTGLLWFVLAYGLFISIIAAKGFAFKNGLLDLATVATPLLRKYGDQSGVFYLAHALDGHLMSLGPILIIASIAFSICFVVAGLSINVRRCHDFDASGFWILLQAVPYLGGLVALGIWLIPGTDGPNRFGPPPAPLRFWAGLRDAPRRLWQGEVPLVYAFWIYAVFLCFFVLDKAAMAYMPVPGRAGLSFAYAGFLALLNCFLAVALWRSATAFGGRRIRRICGRAAAVLLVARVVASVALVLPVAPR